MLWLSEGSENAGLFQIKRWFATDQTKSYPQTDEKNERTFGPKFFGKQAGMWRKLILIARATEKTGDERERTAEAQIDRSIRTATNRRTVEVSGKQRM